MAGQDPLEACETRQMLHVFLADYDMGKERMELCEKVFAFMDAHPIEVPEVIEKV